MLKVAIVGCGKIADSHLEQIQKIPGCAVVAACDREVLMAKQLCERFQIEQAFSDLQQLLQSCRPDVVHITTPPQGHFPIGRQCLEAGAHIYVEKPFTVNTREADELIACARRHGRKLTVGHDLQFSHVARRMRQLVRDGYLEGAPVHMESYYCYELSSPTYAKAFLSNSQHWVRALDGKLLHNIISHGIARIAEYFTGDHLQVFAHGFVSPLLRSLGEEEIIDELRVTMIEDRRATAYFTFSSQMFPSLNQFRVYGPRNGLVIDEDHQTLTRHPGARLKSYAEKFVSPLVLAKQQVGNVFGNMRKFLRNDFHMKSGMKFLIERFYESILRDTPPPISYREILLVSRIMDDIFRQLATPEPVLDNQRAVSDRPAAKPVAQF